MDLFISKPYSGVIYVVERLPRNPSKLIWSATPGAEGPTKLIRAADVPPHIRNRAYRHLNGKDKLYSAANDMLEALKLARPFVETFAAETDSKAKKILNTIDAAIAKAQGDNS